MKKMYDELADQLDGVDGLDDLDEDEMKDSFFWCNFYLNK